MPRLRPYPRPRIFTFDFGAFRIARLLDAVAVREGLAKNVAVGVPEAEFAALAAANHIDANRYEHPFIPTLVDTGSALILFDTGFGALTHEEPSAKGKLPDGALVSLLGELDIAPDDIDIVVITHGHPDHIGGLTRGGVPVFGKARHVFGATEYAFWQQGEGVREARFSNRELFVRTCAKLGREPDLIQAGDVLVPGITAVDARGHSPGLMAYLIESRGRRLLLWSDACSHYITAFQRPDWQVEVDDDKAEAARTRRRLLSIAAAEGLLVAGYHLPFPGLGFAERQGDAFRWAPVGYQLNAGV